MSEFYDRMDAIRKRNELIRNDVFWLLDELRKARNRICDLERDSSTLWHADCGHPVDRHTIWTDNEGKSYCPVCAEELLRELQVKAEEAIGEQF